MGKYDWLNQMIFARTVAPEDAKVPSVRPVNYRRT